jgi:hypothetical protein
MASPTDGLWPGSDAPAPLAEMMKERAFADAWLNLDQCPALRREPADRPILLSQTAVVGRR